MIKIENVSVNNLESAIRGMRNPLNSWDKSDTETVQNNYYAGDMKTHMITVSCDILAPLYWWKEYDTYKVGTVANSCSTMHTICNKEFSVDDFSNEHLSHSADGGAYCKLERVGEWETELYPKALLRLIVVLLNSNRTMYLQTKDKKYWWQIIQLLPSSYNQRRTVLLNYEVLLNMYHSRKNHKLDEWRQFCEWIETLPYMRELLGVK